MMDVQSKEMRTRKKKFKLLFSMLWHADGCFFTSPYFFLSTNTQTTKKKDTLWNWNCNWTYELI